MAARSLTVLMNGVTGRMGYRQHLLRSVLEIRNAGGVPLSDGTRVQIEPVLVGRSAAKLQDMCARHGLDHWTTDVDAAMEQAAAQAGDAVYFDAQVTSQRHAAITRALHAGLHVYTEKPTAETLDEALDLARLAERMHLQVGVVHDKIYLPGLIKLKRLVDAGFFGRILSVRGEFGYWVFEGDWQEAQRPSWNYRAEDGGGITADMFCHWSYVLENIIGRVEAVTAKAVTHIPERVDEHGKPYDATADDAAYAIFELAGGVVAQINSSWAVRVFRDELVEFQVDGTEGSAVAGLRRCVAQQRVHTPRPVWNPDLPATESFREQWLPVPDNAELGNGFRAQWEQFLRAVCGDGVHPYDLLAGARGVQLAQTGLQSSAQGRRLEVPELVL